MTPDLLDLARAVVALPGWRPSVGLRTFTGWTCIDVSGECATFAGPSTLEPMSDRVAVVHTFWRTGVAHSGDTAAWTDGPILPDLTDAATGGCMLAMLVELRLVITTTGNSIAIGTAGPDGSFGAGATLAEACARVALARGRWA